MDSNFSSLLSNSVNSVNSRECSQTSWRSVPDNNFVHFGHPNGPPTWGQAHHGQLPGNNHMRHNPEYMAPMLPNGHVGIMQHLHGHAMQSWQSMQHASMVQAGPYPVTHNTHHQAQHETNYLDFHGMCTSSATFPSSFPAFPQTSGHALRDSSTDNSHAIHTFQDPRMFHNVQPLVGAHRQENTTSHSHQKRKRGSRDTTSVAKPPKRKVPSEESAFTRKEGGIMRLMRDKYSFFRGTEINPLVWECPPPFSAAGHAMRMQGVNIQGLPPMTELDIDIL